MQVIENASRVTGTIRARNRSALSGHVDVTVHIDRATKFDERANLLARRRDHDVVISVPEPLLGDAKEGDRLRLVASVTGPGQVLATEVL